MPAQGTPPPTLPLSGGSNSPTPPYPLGSQSGSVQPPKPLTPAQSPKPPVSPTPVSPKPLQSKPAIPESFTQRPGGGVDVPDPFMSQATSKTNAPSSGMPKASTPGNLAFSTPSTPNISSVSPLAPPAFAKPTLPHRNRKVVALVGGSIVLLLLLTAMGFVLVRFFVGNNSAPITVVTDSPTPSEVPSVIPSATPVASATPTIGSPTPSVDASAEISDVDKDGLTAAEERYYGTDPNNADTDGDGYKDGDEVKAGYDPLGPGKLDSDNDGFPDPDERAFGTDPFNPDTDGDGYKDGDEIAHGHSPLIAAPNDKL